MAPSPAGAPLGAPAARQPSGWADEELGSRSGSALPRGATASSSPDGGYLRWQRARLEAVRQDSAFARAALIDWVAAEQRRRAALGKELRAIGLRHGISPSRQAAECPGGPPPPSRFARRRPRPHAQQQQQPTPDVFDPALPRCALSAPRPAPDALLAEAEYAQEREQLRRQREGVCRHREHVRRLQAEVELRREQGKLSAVRADQRRVGEVTQFCCAAETAVRAAAERIRREKDRAAFSERLRQRRLQQERERLQREEVTAAWRQAAELRASAARAAAGPRRGRSLSLPRRCQSPTRSPSAQPALRRSGSATRSASAVTSAADFPPAPPPAYGASGREPLRPIGEQAYSRLLGGGQAELVGSMSAASRAAASPVSAGAPSPGADSAAFASWRCATPSPRARCGSPVAPCAAAIELLQARTLGFRRARRPGARIAFR
eukprot:TRINITY_DN5754_c0_g1_i1.p1 TRINITY_DN5754_c0_g1~~TRINITY_DN5754_c0_g1_i1.p1  ORF type:complete len:459 (+),score=136.77 TRINITY_DN5754_c0_g1_i1:67-1377(+)